MEQAKKFKVSSFPDIIKVSIKDDITFIMNACDGIWDCYSNEEAIIKVFKMYSKLSKNKDFKLSKIIENLMSNALATDGHSAIGTDNMTCILVQFKEKTIPKKRPYKVTTDFEELKDLLQTSDIRSMLPVLSTHMGHWKFYLRDCEAWNFRNVITIFLDYIKKMPDYILEKHQKDLFGALFQKSCYDSE